MSNKSILDMGIKYSNIKIRESMVFHQEAMSSDGEIIAVLTKEQYGNKGARKIIFELFKLSTKEKLSQIDFNVDINTKNYTILVSPDGSYAACIIENHITLIDCNINKVIKELHGSLADVNIRKCHLLNSGKFIVHEVVLYLLDPFEKEGFERSLLLINKLSKVNKEAGKIMEVKALDSVLSSDGSRLAIVCGDRNYKRELEESEIFIYDIETGKKESLTKTNGVTKRQETEKSNVPKDDKSIRWITNDPKPLNDMYCNSFCFISSNLLGLAWYKGQDYSELVVYDISNNSIVTRFSVPYIEAGYGRDFTFTKMLAIHGHNVFLSGYSMTSDKNAYNTSEENEYENHVIEIDVRNGEIVRKNEFKYPTYVNITRDGNKVVYVNATLIKIGY